MIKRILFVLFFIIGSLNVLCYAASDVSNTSKYNENTQLQTEIQILRSEIAAAQRILDIQMQSHQKEIENAKWHIDGLLIIMGIVAALMTYFIYRENKKAGIDMREAKENYENAKKLSEQSLQSVSQCTDQAKDLINNAKSTIDSFVEIASKKAADQAVKIIKEEQNKQSQINMLVQRFNIKLNQKQYSEALEIAESLIEKAPNEEYGYWAKASTLYGMKERLSEALDNINRAIDLDEGKNKDSLYDLRACIFTLNGQIPEALADRGMIKEGSISQILNYIELLIIAQRLDEAQRELNKLSTKVLTKRYRANIYILTCIIKIICNKQFAIDYQLITGSTWGFQEITNNLLTEKSKLDKKIQENLRKFICQVEKEYGKNIYSKSN